MEMHVVSREIVKPSGPSPLHPKTYRLSQLDQLMNVAYAPITLFYLATEPNNTRIDVRQKLDLLRKSLSETLTSFYPFAGKLKDEFIIDCNDQGAYFVETQVSIKLNKVLGNQLDDLLFLHQFLPCGLGLGEGAAESYVTNVQGNVFECGGIAIGLCISHKIVDGLSTFLHGWASIARGSHKDLVLHPKFNAGSLFPAQDLWHGNMFLETVFGPSLKFGNCITKRFVFDLYSISNLKAQASSSTVEYPTGVEVVSALLWKSMMAASAGELCGSPRKPSLLTHLVNLRRRVVGDDWESSMGNLLWIAAGKYTDTTSKAELEDLVGEIRRATSKINDEFVRQMMATEGEGGRLAMSKSLDEMVSGLVHLGSGGIKEVDCYWFSSWCKIGYYDVDFGWGKPVWVTPIPLTGSVFPNFVMLVDTRQGNGIEAWVSLDEQHMSVMHKEPQILKYASIDPNPLL